MRESKKSSYIVINIIMLLWYIVRKLWDRGANSYEIFIRRCKLDKNGGAFAEGVNDCMRLYSGLIENIYKTVIIINIDNGELSLFIC